MYEPLQPCDALWKVRTRRAQSVFWRCEHADEGGSNPRMWHLGSVCRARSPHSCELCLGHPVRSPQSALAVRIPANPASDTPFAVRSPHSQSAFRPSLLGGPVRSPQSALAVRTRTEIRDGTCPPVSYTHLRAHETSQDLVCRLLLEKKKHITSCLFSRQSTTFLCTHSIWLVLLVCSEDLYSLLCMVHLLLHL